AEDGGGASAALPIQLACAPLTVGERFATDLFGRIEVDRISAARAAAVRTRWSSRGYSDLRITAGTGDDCESPDIWVDAPGNGLGVYESPPRAADPAAPERRGDRLTVRVPNILHARVWNDGDVAARDVEVRFYAHG